MSQKSFISQRPAFCGALMRLLLLAAMALPAWQVLIANEIKNPGTYSRDVMYPWKFVDVHYESFEKDKT